VRQQYQKLLTLDGKLNLDMREKIQRLVDKLGASASFLCAVHCALLPIMVSVLPLLGLSILADEKFEIVMLALAAGLAVVSGCCGYLTHRNCWVVFSFAGALVILGLGALVFHDHHGSYHKHDNWLFMALGGTMLAITHIVNHRLCSRCDTCCEDKNG